MNRTIGVGRHTSVIPEALGLSRRESSLEPPLLNEQVTSDRVKKAVRKLARQREDEDFLLLYFSGHGQPVTVEADQPDVYFVTNDFNEVDVEEDEDAHFS